MPACAAASSERKGEIVKPTKPLRTEISWSTTEKVVVRGHDLVNDLIGKVDLGDMAFLELVGRLPSPNESILFNAVAVTLVEHGLMPSALATRLTYLGAPESVQGAVAAGLLGLGDRYVGSIEGAARELQQAPAGDVREVARAIVERYRASRRAVPGIGHNIHKPVDPRAERLFAIAAETGFNGRHVALMRAISEEGSRAFTMVLPVNATGAIGAVLSEMGLRWEVCRGLGVMARAIGLVAHILEERERPLAEDFFLRAEAEATAWAKDD
ncbi:MAG: citryl-CoA lyase [Chloroflexota bacterium]|nr:citryl-CoA lyase [Chloroflexota bacterium]